MAQSLAQIYVHIIFHVHDKTICREHQLGLWSYIAGIARGMKSMVIIVGGEPDHIHLLCTLPRDITIASFMQEIKQNSSKWIKTMGTTYNDFSWQRGYGIFSVSQSQLETVRKYITNQEEHHKKVSFKDEYLDWLKAYNIDYNLDYLFSD